MQLDTVQLAGPGTPVVQPLCDREQESRFAAARFEHLVGRIADRPTGEVGTQCGRSEERPARLAHPRGVGLDRHVAQRSGAGGQAPRWHPTQGSSPVPLPTPTSMPTSAHTERSHTGTVSDMSADPLPAEPAKYLVIADELRARIMSGAAVPGARLPGENELMKRHAASPG